LSARTRPSPRPRFGACLSARTRLSPRPRCGGRSRLLRSSLAPASGRRCGGSLWCALERSNAAFAASSLALALERGLRRVLALVLRMRASAERSEAASRLSATARRVPCGITFSDGGSERAWRVRWMSETLAVLSKSPLPPAAQEVVPHEASIDSRAAGSGFAALRLRRRRRPRARSEAKQRAGCPRLRGAFRVASLSVMADPNARGVCDGCPKRSRCFRNRHYLLLRGRSCHTGLRAQDQSRRMK
jgi:hypothetical protein